METVLIIDDSGINLRTAKEALVDYIQVVTANSCKMALRYLEKHTPDIILLDIQMPEVDGFETLKAIRSLPQTEDTPIIFLTAQDNVADEIHGLELGAVDYIHKPLQPQIMRMRIRTQLDLAHYQDHLEEIIMQKTEQVARVETALVASLNDLLEIRDGMTGSHVRRTAKYFEILLNALDKAHTFPDAITPDYKVRLLRGAPHAGPGQGRYFRQHPFKAFTSQPGGNGIYAPTLHPLAVRRLPCG